VALCFTLGSLLGSTACSTYDDELLAQAQGATNSGASGAPDGGEATSVGGSEARGGGVAIAGAESSDEGGAAGASGSVPEIDAGGADSGGAAPVGNGGVPSIGGSSGSSVAGAAGGVTTGGSGGEAIELIDDFEDLDTFILLKNKRNGPWYPFNDATAGGVQTFAVSLLTGADVRAGSTAALHMTASGYTDWGAGVGADFVNTAAKKVPYDVSAYKGIRFYAKIAGGTQPAMKMLVPTTYSDPMGGKCSDSVAGMHCNDHLYYPINPLKTTWDVYECDFAELVQQGFGLPQPSLDPTSVYSVQFTFATKLLAADVWIDDVAFVLK
jgi:hypothetical protein